MCGTFLREVGVSWPERQVVGPKEGEGLTAYQKVYKWYSAFAGVTSSAKTNLAMNPDKPNQLSEVPTQLEQWTALVESLEKYGDAYSLGLPFEVTALRVLMGHASDWFDSLQRECYQTPGVLTIETCKTLNQTCEDWARKKRLRRAQSSHLRYSFKYASCVRASGV